VLCFFCAIDQIPNVGPERSVCTLRLKLKYNVWLRSYLLYCDPFRNGTGSESILGYGALLGDSELEH